MRTAIVTIPTIDEAATGAVFALLHSLYTDAELAQSQAVLDQSNMIEEVLCRWCDEEGYDLVLTIGGAMPGPGLSQIQCVPKAMENVLDRRLPGLGETMRAVASEESAFSALDCGVSGIRAQTLIINLPAGSAAAVLFLEAIVELIGPILQHIQRRSDAPQITPLPASAQPGQAGEDPGQAPLFDSDEFADFLKRRDQD